MLANRIKNNKQSLVKHLNFKLDEIACVHCTGYEMRCVWHTEYDSLHVYSIVRAHLLLVGDKCAVFCTLLWQTRFGLAISAYSGYYIQPIILWEFDFPILVQGAVTPLIYRFCYKNIKQEILCEQMSDITKIRNVFHTSRAQSDCLIFYMEIHPSKIRVIACFGITYWYPILENGNIFRFSLLIHYWGGLFWFCFWQVCTNNNVYKNKVVCFSKMFCF